MIILHLKTLKIKRIYKFFSFGQMDMVSSSKEKLWYALEYKSIFITKSYLLRFSVVILLKHFYSLKCVIFLEMYL